MIAFLPVKLRLAFIIACTTTILVISSLIGLISHFVYWLLFDSLGRSSRRAKRKLKWINNQRDIEYYTIIVGSGFSGIGMAVRMNQLGMDNYIIIERHGHVGGTWYANKYPGCACDVPSILYSFSFELNPNWSHYFSRQAEIRTYLEYCVDKYDIRRHIRFNTTVTEMKWLEERLLWQVTTQTNEGEKVFYARSIVLGFGPLSNAAYPTDIEGIDKFQGQMCHTAEWNSQINFENKRVAVIGTGASAIQIVPEIQRMNPAQLYVFQRTPPWIIPRLDREIANSEKEFFRRYPIVLKIGRAMLYWAMESTILSFVYRWPTRFIIKNLAKYNLELQVKDKNLRKKLMPTFDLGCKRMLFTNDWYSTLQKPNVNVVTNRIKEIKAKSIVTFDGDEYPVDIIIWSTGFQAQEFTLPVYGINGRTLSEEWSQTVQAYRGVTVPNFPNFYVLLGPNTALGHSSVVIIIEAQINYIAEAFLYMDGKSLNSVEIKRNAFETFNRKLQSKLKKTVWQQGGCHSWYQDSQGNNTIIWPDFTWVYILLMKNFDYENYISRI